MKKIRNNEIFLSYSWNDTKIADNIDNLLKKHGIVFNRDKNDIDTWGSIRKYMSSIRKTDYALIIISESYLKSVNCMYEILELMKENEYKEKDKYLFYVVCTRAQHVLSIYNQKEIIRKR